MTHWVIGDIHGQYYALRAMLENMDIENDEIYFIGDYVDWGKYSIKTLKFLMKLTSEHSNIKCLLGNHDKMMLDANSNKISNIATKIGASSWAQNGGFSTMRKFSRLPKNEQKEIVNWLKSLKYHYEISVGDSNFYLAHAYTLSNKTISSKARHDAIWRRVKVGENPFASMGDKYSEHMLICGHTISNRYTHGSFEVFFDKRFIILDCGAKVLDKYPRKARIAAIRLDDMQLFYINCIDADNWRWNNINEWS